MDLDSLMHRKLRHNLYDDYGALVVPKGTYVSKAVFAKLINHPISFIPDYMVTEDLDDQMYASIVSTAVTDLESIFARSRHADTAPLVEMRQKIVPAISACVNHSHLGRLLQLLKVKDDYTAVHSFAVCVLSTLLGRWLKLCEADIRSLMSAAALHDIGKTKIPDGLLNKPDRLSSTEFEEMKRHTVIGYEMIKNTPGTSQVEALAALQHHEKIDGSGYPFGVTEDRISPFAKIIAAADIFHAMSSRRPYKAQQPLNVVLTEMESSMYGKLDATIVFTFIYRMMEGLIGAKVVLTNGNKYKIVLIHRDNPTRPLLQGASDYLDLATTPSAEIVEIVEEA